MFIEGGGAGVCIREEKASEVKHDISYESY